MKKKILIIFLIILGIGLIGLGVFYFFINESLHIRGYNDNEVVEVKSVYMEEMTICYGTFFNCEKIDYEINGDYDFNKIGEYELKYSYEYGEKKNELTKKFKVVDTTAPVLEVKNVTICPNLKIVEGDYKVSDNYDIDLNDKIEIIKTGIEKVDNEVSKDENEENENNESNENEEIKDNEVTKENNSNVDEENLADKKEKITYYMSVKDSSGNETKELIEPSILLDNMPTITLTGGTTYIVIGGSYKESGYTANDICDGEITNNVKVENNVNTKSAGTYYVTYSVTNSNGITASVKRTVKVIKKNQTVNPSSKTIYLTFDDGPGPYTARLLGILDKYNVKATFFVTNQFNNTTYLKNITEEANKGHTVAIHSYTHNFNIYRSIDTYFDDLNKMNEVIKKYTGSYSTFLRFPGGSSNTISRNYSKGIMSKLVNEVEARGYSYYDWNLDSGDSGSATSKSKVYNQVTKNLTGSGNKMILMHDIKSYTVDAIEDIIIYGLEHGYTFSPIIQTTPTFHHGTNN